MSFLSDIDYRHSLLKISSFGVGDAVLIAGELDWVTSKGPFQLKRCYDSIIMRAEVPYKQQQASHTTQDPSAPAYHDPLQWVLHRGQSNIIDLLHGSASIS